MALPLSMPNRQPVSRARDDMAALQPSPLLRGLAYLLTLVVLAAAGSAFIRQWQGILDLRPVEVHLWAKVAEDGGWQVDSLRMPSGRTVRLTVHGVSGAHTFALAHTGIAHPEVIQPGESATLEFVAPAPGRYVLYCTTWCSLNHWRMRTVVEVYDPADEAAPLAYVQSPARYRIEVEGHMLDMPHLGEVWPAAKPDAARGAALFAQAAQTPAPAALLVELDWPNVSPAQAFTWLRSGKLGEGVAEDATWDMAAYLWQQAATPAERAQGQVLYQQNCAACHGDQGQGDGFGAAGSPEVEPDLTDLRAAAGASSALLYAKIARGGMGTGMPNWGTLLTEDELWALVAYLQTFAYTPAPEANR